MRDRSRTTVQRACQRAALAAALVALAGTPAMAGDPSRAIGPMPPLPLPGGDGVYSNPFCVPSSDNEVTHRSSRHAENSQATLRLVSGGKVSPPRLKPAVTGVVLSPLQLASQAAEASKVGSQGASDKQSEKPPLTNARTAPALVEEVRENPYASGSGNEEREPKGASASAASPAPVAAQKDGDGVVFTLSDRREKPAGKSQSDHRKKASVTNAKSTTEAVIGRSKDKQYGSAQPAEPRATSERKARDAEATDDFQPKHDVAAVSKRPSSSRYASVVEAVAPVFGRDKGPVTKETTKESLSPQPSAEQQPLAENGTVEVAVAPHTNAVTIDNPPVSPSNTSTSAVVREAMPPAPTAPPATIEAEVEPPRLVSPRKAAVIRVEPVDAFPQVRRKPKPTSETKTPARSQQATPSARTTEIVEAPPVHPVSPFMRRPLVTEPHPTSSGNRTTTPSTTRSSTADEETKLAEKAEKKAEADEAVHVQIEVSGKRAAAKVIRPPAVPARIHVVKQPQHTASPEQEKSGEAPSVDVAASNPAPIDTKSTENLDADAAGRSTENLDADAAGRLRPPVAVVNAPVSFKRGLDKASSPSPAPAVQVAKAMPMVVDPENEKGSDEPVAASESESEQLDFWKDVPADAPRSNLKVELAQVRSLTLSKSLKQYRVADDSVCQVIQSGHSQLKLIGTGVGSTQLIVWAEPKETAPAQCLVFDIEVKTALDASGAAEVMTAASRLDKSIRHVFPTSRVRVGYDGNRLIVYGYCDDQRSATEILRLVRKSCLIPVVDALVIR